VDEPELSHNGFLNGWVAAGSHNGDLGREAQSDTEDSLGKRGGGGGGRREVSESVILTEN
jgi:hypothetical protein